MNKYFWEWISLMHEHTRTFQKHVDGLWINFYLFIWRRLFQIYKSYSWTYLDDIWKSFINSYGKVLQWTNKQTHMNIYKYLAEIGISLVPSANKKALNMKTCERFKIVLLQFE